MSEVSLSDQNILERFARILGKSLSIDPQEVTEDSYMDELGADSLDFLEITMEAEEEFAISMPERNIFQIVQEVFGQEVLEKNGVLSEEGKKFLMRRMPELDPKELEGEIRVSDLNHYFARVGTWVRMIRELMHFTPRECPSCGAELTEYFAGRMKCACGEETDIPSGDEVNKKWVQEYYEREYRPAQSSQGI